MLDAGLLATVNSDDPAYFGGYAGDNLEAVASALGLGGEQVVTLARNSFEASFLEAPQRSALLAPHRMTLHERLAKLAALGATADGIDRALFTPAERAAREHFVTWAREDGLRVEQDRAGNVFARLDVAGDGVRRSNAGRIWTRCATAARTTARTA